MLFIELFSPAGVLARQDRVEIARKLLTGILPEGGGPAGTIRSARSLAQVVVHEPEAWITGPELDSPIDAPPFIVRVTVPAGHMSEGKRREIISRVTGVLSAYGGDPERVYCEPAAWVLITEIPEGGCGAFGRPMLSSDLVRLVLSSAGAAPAEADAAAPDAFVDPVCGMTVPAGRAVTLERDGRVVGFCCNGCREVFRSQNAGAEPR